MILVRCLTNMIREWLFWIIVANHELINFVRFVEQSCTHFVMNYISCFFESIYIYLIFQSKYSSWLKFSKEKRKQPNFSWAHGPRILSVLPKWFVVRWERAVLGFQNGCRQQPSSNWTIWLFVLQGLEDLDFQLCKWRLEFLSRQHRNRLHVGATHTWILLSLERANLR